jgi:hypothetical protein
VPTLTPLGRTCSALMSSDFVEEKKIKDKKKKHDIFASLR